jgi:hypothetical protein
MPSGEGKRRLLSTSNNRDASAVEHHHYHGSSSHAVDPFPGIHFLPDNHLQHRKVVAGAAEPARELQDGAIEDSSSSRQLLAAASIPVIEGAADAGSGVLPTVQPPLTLDEMLCATSWRTAKPQANCSAPGFGYFSYKGTTFKPVKLPIIIHGECTNLEVGGSG